MLPAKTEVEKDIPHVHVPEMPIFADVDDLIARSQLSQILQPIHDANPNFRVLAFAVPNRLGNVEELQREFPFVSFGIHGWEHAHFECLTWTTEDTINLVGRALDMGYAPIFRAPNWLLDPEVEQGLKSLGVVLAHHPEKYRVATPGLKTIPAYEGQLTSEVQWLHTHILKNPSTDYITDIPEFAPGWGLDRIWLHWTDLVEFDAEDEEEG